MAKIQEDVVLIKFSRLIRDTDKELGPVLDSDQLNTLCQATEGLVDDPSIIVEVVEEP